MEPWVNFIQAYFIKLGHENDIFLILFVYKEDSIYFKKFDINGFSKQIQRIL